jgi:hypothetical protein
MQKLQLEGQKVAIQQKKLEVEAADKADKLDVERERIAAQKEIAGMQAGVKAAHDKASLSAKQQTEGLRIGAEVARNRLQMQQQANQPQQPKKGDNT